MTEKTKIDKYLSITSSFIIMLCIGSIYAWSIFVAELKNSFGFSTMNTQAVFGTHIAVLALTMIFINDLELKYGPRIIVKLSSIFFGAGYLLAGMSNGNFYVIYFGIGLVAGIGTGAGYFISLTLPVKWFPEKKGLVTGIASAGFGLASIILTNAVKPLFLLKISVLNIFAGIGIIYALIIFTAAAFIKNPCDLKLSAQNISTSNIFSDPKFYKLTAGLFCGSFAGLLIIGNLKPIGMEHNIDKNILMFSVSVFAAANFTGRLFWGWISDIFDGGACILTAFLLQACFIFLKGYMPLSAGLYIFLTAAIGFGFGANFVLFAKETAQIYGVGDIGRVYPYVFSGYALAGILGPATGGLIFDIMADYSCAAYISSFICLIGACIYYKKS